MRRTALLGWLFAALVAPSVQAQNIGDFGYRHVENHEWYSRELPPVCCHGGDCRETLAKFTPTGWLALVDGLWRAVPEATVLRNGDGTPRLSPDQRAHVCASQHTKAIFCFLPPDYEG